jgi:hypothetical protein
MISEERAERAVEFIRDHADQLGELLGYCKSLEQRRKVVFGTEFLEAEGTVAEREARAHASDAFLSVVKEIENAWAEKTTVETKLRAAELTIDVWRSQFSKYGKGHV